MIDGLTTVNERPNERFTDHGHITLRQDSTRNKVFRSNEDFSKRKETEPTLEETAKTDRFVES